MFQFWKHSGYDVDLSQLKKKKPQNKKTNRKQWRDKIVEKD